MSLICSRKAVDSARSRTDTTIKADTVGPGTAAYLHVGIPRGPYGIYAVTIVYTSDI